MKTKAIKKVLIALDYDPTAQKVAEIGFLIAKSMQSEVVLLNVLTDAEYYTALDNEPLINVMGFHGYDASVLFKTDGLNVVMKNYLDKVKLHLENTAIKTIVEKGDCAETILSVSAKIDADVIVLGSHSKQWLESIIMGSVAEKVLKHTLIPVLIIPTKQVK